MTKLLIAVDIAKEVFEVAVAQPSGKILERKRMPDPSLSASGSTAHLASMSPCCRRSM